MSLRRRLPTRGPITLALVLSLALMPSAGAIPPDQPPMEGSVTTPNVPYTVRGGVSGTYDYFSQGKLLQAGRALDRSGTAAPGNPLGYHAGYLARGFRAPYFSTGNNDVVFWGCGSNPNTNGYDCDNGRAALDQIIMPADVYRNKSDACIRVVLGHELFHHIQFGYTADGGYPTKGCGVIGSTACEGQSRANQDKIYFDADLDPAVSCVAGFRGEANGYLAAPDIDILKSSYRSALFWTYLMEQYGEYAFEPGRGIDFLTNWWDLATLRMASFSLYDVTERAIRVSHPDDSLLNAFHDFTIANYVKGLNLASTSDSFRARYTYRDEDPVPLHDNRMKFNSAAITESQPVPTDGSPRTFDNAVKRFGARYYEFDTSSCPAGSVLNFDAAPGVLIPVGPNAQAIVPDALYTLVASRLDSAATLRPVTLLKHRARSWHQELVQPATPNARIVAIVSGWHSDYAGSISLRCRPPAPTPTLSLISTAHPAVSGASGDGSVGELLVRIPQSIGAASPLLPTLAGGEFTLTFGGAVAAPLAALRDGDNYRLLFQYPALPAGAGTVDASVAVAGSAPTVSGGVRVAPHQPAVLVAIDTTASMGTPSGATRLDNARTAAREFSAGLPASARLGLLRFAGNGALPAGNVSLLAPLAPLTPGQRSAFDTALSAVAPSTELKVKMTDILVSSIAEFDAHDGGGERHLVLFTDSAEAAGFDSAGFIAAAQAAGIRVEVIALGASADQPLLARIGRETGGSYDYIDELSAGAGNPPTPLLLPAVQKVREAAARMRSTTSGTGTVPAGATANFDLVVDPGDDQAAGGHVKVFSGVDRSGTAFSGVRLYRPDNSQVVPGAGVDIAITGNRFTFTIANAPAGTWKLQVDGSAAGGTASVAYRAQVLDPARGLRMAFSRPGADARTLDHFKVGEPVAAEVAVLDLANSLPSPSVTLTKVGPGTLAYRMYDDGSHGDRQAGDHIFTTVIASRQAGTATGFADTGAGTGTVGSYEWMAKVTSTQVASGAPLQLQGGYAVVDDLPADTDGDGLPDRYEARYACLSTSVADAATDSDGDGASNNAEYLVGSDPCDVDSDDGGETDGSEIAHGGNPLDGSDDALPRIRNLEIERQHSEHQDADPLPALANVLRYDADPAYTAIVLKRAPLPTGPFVDVATISTTSGQGRYVDGGLTNGANYCYQLVGQGSGGRVAAASDIQCAVVHLDNDSPTGSLIVNEGAPRTSGNTLTVRIGLYHEEPTTSQMKLVLPDGSDTGWIPYSASYTVNVATLQRPGVAAVRVILRDAAGNESVPYVDDIDLVAISARGRLPGLVNVDPAFAAPGTPIAGCTISPDAETEAPSTSTASGDFALEDLPPGTYAITIDCPGYQSRTLSGIVVTGGGTSDQGVIAMSPAVLFSNGFE